MSRADNPPFPDIGGRTPTILIVEDETLIRMSLSDYLDECGFCVVEAANAAEAVKLIENAPGKIDLVFSDVRMPGEMDGVGLAMWVKQNYPGLPIFLASADATKVELAHKLCSHEEFFAKPYEVKVVVEHIRTILSANKSAN